MTITAPNVEYGDPTIAYPNEILRTVVGSGVHGIAIEGTDDHDEMGIFIEPPERVIGLAKPMDHYVFRTQPEGARSGPGDVDRIIYSLRKWLRLAIKGNPTVLIPLWCPDSDVINTSAVGSELRHMREAFMSQEAAERVLGYMDQQRRGMLGLGGAKIPSRPELVEKYGYDTKYAAHALRLAIQGLEIVEDGRLTLPMCEQDRHAVINVKQGHVSRELVIAMVADLEAETRALLNRGETPLPPKPDRARISAWSIRTHLRWWGVPKVTLRTDGSIRSLDLRKMGPGCVDVSWDE